jgi:hypothetical protein
VKAEIINIPNYICGLITSQASLDFDFTDAVCECFDLKDLRPLQIKQLNNRDGDNEYGLHQNRKEVAEKMEKGKAF